MWSRIFVHLTLQMLNMTATLSIFIVSIHTIELALIFTYLFSIFSMRLNNTTSASPWYMKAELLCPTFSLSYRSCSCLRWSCSGGFAHELCFIHALAEDPVLFVLDDSKLEFMYFFPRPRTSFWPLITSYLITYFM